MDRFFFLGSNFFEDVNPYEITAGFALAAPHALVLADLNADGLPDLVVGTVNGANRYYINPATPGRFDQATATTFGVSLMTRAVAVADMDGDGVLDILVGNQGEKNELHLASARLSLARMGSHLWP